ncbi:MAG: amino acid-binding ACT protein, partial [Acidimicrobiia bacterium]|nr:amino acid-binding ACT protein [Acidimicrobiia bacterium]
AITRNGGNWERSEMIELAGKFAGVVLVTVAPSNADALKADLEQIEASGLLNIIIEDAPAAPAAAPSVGRNYTVHITGQDHPGIVHDLSHALATSRCSIDELSSEVVPAPMGGEMFVAHAVVGAPENMSLRDLQEVLENVASDLLVDVEA